MKWNLINGDLTQIEVLQLLEELVHMKIRLLENRIVPGSHEEDVEIQERAIAKLQNEYSTIKKRLLLSSLPTDVEVTFEFNNP